MKSWFRKREYPEGMLNSNMIKVTIVNIKIKNNDKDSNMKCVLLVATYHPLRKSVSNT